MMLLCQANITYRFRLFSTSYSIESANQKHKIPSIFSYSETYFAKNAISKNNSPTSPAAKMQQSQYQFLIHCGYFYLQPRQKAAKSNLVRIKLAVFGNHGFELNRLGMTKAIGPRSLNTYILKRTRKSWNRFDCPRQCVRRRDE